MSTWDDVLKEYEQEIGPASEEYIKAANILPFSVGDIKAVFSEEELEDVAKFIKEMKEAADDNNRKYELIAQYKTVAVGLLKLAKVVV